MNITRREFIKSGTSALAVSSGLLLILPQIAKGQSYSGLESASPEKFPADSSDSLPNLNRTDFANQIGTQFNISSEEYGTSNVTLFRVNDLPQTNNEKGFITEGFSLLFSVPRRQNLYQDAYIINHQTLGSFQLLLVPVLMNQQKPVLYYEAIINRLV